MTKELNDVQTGTISKQERNKFKRVRMFNYIMLILAYISYYVVKYSWRKSLAIEFPGQDHAVLFGTIAMIFSMTYGFSKFVSGNLIERYSARVFISVGLLGTSVFNLLSGLYSNFIYLGIMLAFVAWFQGHGWPSVAKMFSRWLTTKERPKWHSVWNGSHNIGGAISPFLIVPLAFVSVPTLFGLMFIPSVMGIVVAIILWFALRNEPQEYGLKDFNSYAPKKYKESDKGMRFIGQKPLGFKTVLFNTITNKWLWIIGFGDVCIYTIRNGIGQWLFKIMKDYHGVDIKNSHEAGFANLAYELSGVFGIIIAGFASSRFLKGDVRLSLVIGAAVAGLGVLLFWATPKGNIAMAIGALIIIGVFMYIPQGLSGTFCMSIVDRRMVASAATFNGFIAYMVSAITANLILGFIIKDTSYSMAFIFIAMFGFMAAILYATTFFRADAITPADIKELPHWLKSKKEKENKEVNQDDIDLSGQFFEEDMTVWNVDEDKKDSAETKEDTTDESKKNKDK